MIERGPDRNEIVAALVKALELLDYIHAVWEGGAASWSRIDAWSDIDLYVVCDDECVEDTLDILEKAVTAISDIDLRFRVPEPAWHGHSQVFWRLKNASPFLFLDIAVMKKSSTDKFLQTGSTASRWCILTRPGSSRMTRSTRMSMRRSWRQGSRH